jgi:ribosomal protein S18 acetylase RimI-like enzyme
MERLKCAIREGTAEDRSLLLLLADETLRPLAEASEHPERYRTGDIVDLLVRADVFVAEAEGEPAGFMAVEWQDDALAIRCVCVGPAFEARGVANQLVDWAEGLALSRRARRLTAEAPAADQPSQHLYRGHGFVPPAGEAGAGVLEKRLPTPED